ncbi:hypothetical protein KPH14_000867 [Odynerus spinipes]|uniref:Uncharacterized protein n=1 Tax=Odynerus spinipes TaxID=1348599 RepID=A0AAD9RE82_9HYME|nr:hypothetical protein KPH14_000867 [Odynerus spinipes]
MSDPSDSSDSSDSQRGAMELRKFYRGCKKTVKNAVECANCQSLYHPSCSLFSKVFVDNEPKSFCRSCAITLSPLEMASRPPTPALEPNRSGHRTSSLSPENISLSTILTAVKDSSKATKTQITELSTKLDEIPVLSRKVDDCFQKIEALCSAHSILVDKFASIEEENRILKTRCGTLETAIDTCEKKNSKLNAVCMSAIDCSNHSKVVVFRNTMDPTNPPETELSSLSDRPKSNITRNYSPG